MHSIASLAANILPDTTHLEAVELSSLIPHYQVSENCEEILVRMLFYSKYNNMYIMHAPFFKMLTYRSYLVQLS